MTRPAVEVADILRVQGDNFREQNRFWLGYQQLSVLRAITRCRTAALGGHLDSCSRCDLQAISYNSCRNRHCPKCQATARAKWLAARESELLPVPYFHVVFTLPKQIVGLALQNAREIYNILFRAASETLLTIAADPKRLGDALARGGNRPAHDSGAARSCGSGDHGQVSPSVAATLAGSVESAGAFATVQRQPDIPRVSPENR